MLSLWDRQRNCSFVGNGLFQLRGPHPCFCTEHQTSDFFMYRAETPNAPLELLPRPEPLISRDHPFGIFPRGEYHYTVASLNPLGSDQNLFSVRLYDPETNIWSWKKLCVESPQKEFPVDIPDNFYPLLSHYTFTVITLGKTIIGWADLCRGILFCDMLSESEKHTQ